MKQRVNDIQRFNNMGSRWMLGAVLFAAVAGLCRDAQGDQQYATGSFTWDNGTTAAWSATSGGPYNQLWVSGNDAVFEGTSGTVTVAVAGATVHNITFSATGCTITNNTLTLNGTLPTATLGNDVNAFISSAIAGSSGFAKNGAGLLTLIGGNTCSGGTTVNDGTLEIGNGIANGTVNGPYDIKTGATLRLNRASAMAINNAYTGGGTLTLATPDPAVDWAQCSLNAAFTGKVSIASGRLYGTTANLGGITEINVSAGGQFLTFPVGSTYTQTLALSGNRIIAGSVPDTGVLRLEGSTWQGPIHLLGNTFIAITMAPSHIKGVISGAYDLTFAKSFGAAKVVLSGSNTYSGKTTLTSLPAGDLELSLGDGTSGHDGTLNTSEIYVNTGAILTYNLFGDQLVSYPITGAKNCSLVKKGQGTLTLNNTGAVGFGDNGSTLSVMEGQLVYTNLVNNNGPYQTSIFIASNTVLEMNVDAGRVNAFGGWTSTYTGQGTLRKSGEGTLKTGFHMGLRYFSFERGALIDIQAGKFVTDNLRGSWGANKASVSVSSNAMFDFRGDDVWIDSLLGAGGVFNSYGTRTLTLGVADGSGTFTGVIFENDVGTVSLKKTGTGVQVLGGANLYTGATIVSNGNLVVNGSLAAASTVAVYTNATLGGTGTVYGVVTTAAGATLSPGDPLVSQPYGTLTLNQSPVVNHGTRLRIDVSTDGQSDTLSVEGDIDLSKLTLEVADVELLNKAKTYTVLTYTGTAQGVFEGTNLTGAWHVSYSTPGTAKIVCYNGTIITIL